MDRNGPVGALLVSVFILSFLGGVYVAHHEIFPYQHLRDAVRTLRVLVQEHEGRKQAHFGMRIESADVHAAGAANARWTILDPAIQRLPIIAYGGLNQYLEHCPDQGCLAVAFDGDGNVTEAWPYDPVEIFSKDLTEGAYPHEMVGFNPVTDVYPVGIQRYSDGSLLVTFQARDGGIFPFGMGVARIESDGSPRWTRFDYSHHWATLGADGVAYVPGLKIGDASLRVTYGAGPSLQERELRCSTDRPQLDVVQIIDDGGHVVEEIELVPIFLRSHWAGLLPETTNACDPLHLNYIDRIAEDSPPGLASGDLVLSLRNLSRFVILDSSTREIKRVVAGGFVQQHAVQHVTGSRFLMFDNRGGDTWGPASRIVELDLANGTERRVFPNERTPQEYSRIFSDRAGHLHISQDRERVLASFTHAGRAFEIDIASGRLLAVYDNVHDISSLPNVPQENRQRAARFSIYGMNYLQE